MKSNITFDHPENPNAHFTIVGNAIFLDKEISWAAKGLYCQLCSVPKEHFQVSKEGLVKMSRTGKDATNTAMDELIKHGYVKTERMHDIHGYKKCYSYTIFRDPKGIVAEKMRDKEPKNYDWDEPF